MDKDIDKDTYEKFAYELGDYFMTYSLLEAFLHQLAYEYMRVDRSVGVLMLEKVNVKDLIDGIEALLNALKRTEELKGIDRIKKRYIACSIKRNEYAHRTWLPIEWPKNFGRKNFSKKRAKVEMAQASRKALIAKPSIGMNKVSSKDIRDEKKKLIEVFQLIESHKNTYISKPKPIRGGLYEALLGEAPSVEKKGKKK